jgi:hypothetical protein
MAMRLSAFVLNTSVILPVLISVNGLSQPQSYRSTEDWVDLKKTNKFIIPLSHVTIPI